MSFKVGDPRPSKAGRKKGTANKKTQLLIDKAKELDCDPFEILLRFAKGDWSGLGYEDKEKIVAYSVNGEPIYDMVITPEMRLKAAGDACQYLHPKRKAIEMQPGEDGGVIPRVMIWETAWGSAKESSDDNPTSEN